MKAITLQDACAILAIDIATLYRWMGRAGVTVQKDEHDKRRRMITLAQVRQLAKLHHRALPAQHNEQGPESSDVDTRIAALEQRVQSLEQELAALRTVATVAPPITRPRSSTSSAIKITQEKSDLPSGLVPAATFAKLHGFTEAETNTVRKAIAHGRLPAMRNEAGWHHGRATVKEALDEQGRHVFWQLYHHRADFISCSDCPHIVESARQE